MFRFWEQRLLLPASGDSDAGGTSGETEEQDETPEESDESGESEEDGEAEDELDEEDTKKAKLLFKALQDPTRSTDIIRGLASKLGLLDNKPPTKTEVKEGKKAIIDIVKDNLGEAYSGILGEKLTKILETVLSQERESTQADQARTQADIVSAQIESVYDKLSRETKGEAKKFRGRMEEIAKEVQPSEGTSIEKYMRHLYALATAGSKEKSIKTKTADKINRNAADTGSRISTTQGSTGKGGKTPQGPRTLKQIVTDSYDAQMSAKD